MEKENIEVEEKDKDKIATKPKGSYIDIVRLKAQVIEELTKKELEPFEFIKTNEINVLLDNSTILELANKNKISVLKWHAKRGKDFDEEINKTTQERFFVVRLISELVKNVCGHYGIAGGDFTDYYTFALSLFHDLEREKVDNWKGKIQLKIRLWSLKCSAKEEVLKVLALVIAKFTTKYLYEGLI
jgi:hypothetical protein